MDNLVEQLRALAVFAYKPLLTQAADTIAAQARLLELAETMAGAAKNAPIGYDHCGRACGTCNACRLEAAINAFTAAQAEYASTGRVPCPECTLWQELFNKAADERDEARSQLEAAQKLHDAARAMLIDYRGQRDEAQADNAALVEALNTYGECRAYCTSGIGHTHACDCGLVNLKTQPHPGAPMLEELAALRAELADLKARDERSIEALKAAMDKWGYTDATRHEPRWERFISTVRAYMEPEDRAYLDAIRNREGR